MCCTDGVDRTQCCVSKRVSGRCLGVCSGNVTNIPTNLFDCATHLSSFTSCYGIPQPTIPPVVGEFSNAVIVVINHNMNGMQSQLPCSEGFDFQCQCSTNNNNKRFSLALLDFDTAALNSRVSSVGVM